MRMEAPHSDPVGVPVRPPHFAQTPRTYRWPARVAASVMLSILLAVASITTALSLGAYCLTSDGANTRALLPPTE